MEKKCARGAETEVSAPLAVEISADYREAASTLRTATIVADGV